MSLIALDARTDTYQTLQGTIKGTVGRFCQRYHTDFDDMLSRAHVAFLEAFDTFDHERGMAFSSYVIQKINFALIETYRETARRAGLHASKFGQAVVDGLDFAADKTNPFFLVELLDELSEDGRTVVHLTLHTRDVQHTMLEQTHYTNDATNTAIRNGARTALREVLNDLGWTAARISESFQEIANALSGE